VDIGLISQQCRESDLATSNAPAVIARAIVPELSTGVKPARNLGAPSLPLEIVARNRYKK